MHAYGGRPGSRKDWISVLTRPAGTQSLKVRSSTDQTHQGQELPIRPEVLDVLIDILTTTRATVVVVVNQPANTSRRQDLRRVFITRPVLGNVRPQKKSSHDVCVNAYAQFFVLQSSHHS